MQKIFLNRDNKIDKVGAIETAQALNELTELKELVINFKWFKLCC